MESMTVGARSQGQMGAFRDMVGVCALEHLGYTGSSWTFEKRCQVDLIQDFSYQQVVLDVSKHPSIT